MNMHWTEDETDYLINNAPTMTAKELSDELPRRSVGGVRDKLNALGVVAKRVRGNAGVQLRIKRTSPLWVEG